MSFFKRILLFSENTDLKIDDIRRLLISRMVFVILIMATPTLIIAGIEAIKINLPFTSIIYFSTIIPIVVAFIFRKKIPAKILVVLLFIIGFIIGTINIRYYGLSGPAIPIFFMVSVFATIFFGIRNGIISLLMCSIPILVFGILYTNNIIEFKVDIFSLIHVPMAWASALAVLLFLGSIIIFGYGFIQENLIQSSQIVRLQSKELEIANKNLKDEINKLKIAQIDLRISKEKSEESDSLKTAFLRNISHEFRTPINGIVGYSSLLNMPEIDSSKQGDYIKQIQNSCNQLLNIVNDTIEIAQVETNSISNKISDVDVNDVINNLFSLNLMKAADKGIKLKYTSNFSEMIIRSDRIKLYRILFHLIDNAIKFTNEGEVIISTQKNHSDLIISIKDMKPYSLESVVSDGIVLYALEANKGWFTKHDIKIGDQIEFR